MMFAVVTVHSLTQLQSALVRDALFECMTSPNTNGEPGELSLEPGQSAPRGGGRRTCFDN